MPARGTSTRPKAGAALPPLTNWIRESLERLARATGATRCALLPVDPATGLETIAWGDVGDRPEPATLDALASLAAPSDLGGPDAPPGCAPALAVFAAAAAVRTSIGPGREPALAVLALGGGDADPPGGVRPRTLAALGALADELAPPLAAASTLSSSMRDAGPGEEALFRTSRLAALGELLAEVVHEIRNPLVSVKTFLELMPERRDDPDFYGRFREVVTDEVRRIERLCNALLDHARPTAREADGENESAGLGAVLESTGRLLEQRARERGLALAIDVGADLPRAAIGEDALRQIVLNLSLNALEATDAGSRVRLTATRFEGGLELCVDDGGPGVPAQERERVFEPFYSSRPDRVGGLGLAVSLRLARAAGGTIAVLDAPGGGARFRVRLPEERPAS